MPTRNQAGDQHQPPSYCKLPMSFIMFLSLIWAVFIIAVIWRQDH